MHTLTLSEKVVKKDFTGAMKIGYVIGTIKLSLTSETRTKSNSQILSGNGALPPSPCLHAKVPVFVERVHAGSCYGTQAWSPS